MAYGTESIPKVSKIFGPGNVFVTTAKMLVFGEVAIDMPAGPSEILVFADQNADASLVAADLLSQLEHGEDSQAILVLGKPERHRLLTMPLNLFF
jgi:histidinol dehydrogenase